ncbi:hypothetical protein [Absidia glauca]|uniref:Uncharacterized protein n=1 Tax=Absidia glauca TaxID=4829 RepID=A0A163TDR6_ABSGL|nr:hypothetical protein [Absidia glauca]
MADQQQQQQQRHQQEQQQLQLQQLQHLDGLRRQLDHQYQHLHQQHQLENLALTTQQQLEDLTLGAQPLQPQPQPQRDIFHPTRVLNGQARQVSINIGVHRDFLRQALGQEDVKLHAKTKALLMIEMFPEDADRVWGAVPQLSKQWGIEHLENHLEENGLPAFRAAREWVARTLLAQAWKNEYKGPIDDCSFE